jgi:AraC-like DNA-binding protein/ligand-binding sensor protein
MADIHKLDLASRLSGSQIFRDYERAFSEATGLALAFQPKEQLRPALRQSKWVNEFCMKLTETSLGCRLCVEMQADLCKADGQSHTGTCQAGLTDSAVPVRVGERTLGFLQTGQVALNRKPSRENFRRVMDWLQQGGAETDWAALEKAYLNSPVLSREQYAAMVRLLEVFAQHLSIAAEQIATQQSNAEPALVRKAREYIEQHQDEDLGLEHVAKAVHASTFHFCKTFKKATGFTFTQYLSLVRIARAKQLLADPQKRISEIAYEVGFQSLTHFNRVFRKVAGRSPTDFRAREIPVNAMRPRS